MTEESKDCCFYWWLSKLFGFLQKVSDKQNGQVIPFYFTYLNIIKIMKIEFLKSKTYMDVTNKDKI